MGRVRPRAAVYFLRPRVVFVGHRAGYPKDLALICYSSDKPGYFLWNLKEDANKRI